jgi:polysaccharide transporter, PST family
MLQQLLTNNAVLLLQYAASALVPLVLIPHIVRSIGIGTYGELAVAMSWAGYGILVVQYAFQLTGPQRLAQLPHGQTGHGRIFQAIQNAKYRLFVGVVLAMLLVYFMSSRSNHVSVLSLLLILPMTGLLNAGWYLQALGRFGTVSLISVVGSCGALLTGLFLVKPNHAVNEFYAALALMISPLIAGMGTFWVARKLAAADVSNNFSTVDPTSVLKEGWPVFISQSISALYTLSGPILISILAGREEAGIYAVVDRIANAILGACLLVHTAAYPKLAVYYARDRVQYWWLMRYVCLIFFMGVLIVGTLGFFFQNRVIHYMFGSVISSNCVILLYLGITWIAMGLFGPLLTGYLIVAGRRELVLRFNLLVLAASLILGLGGMAKWGAAGWLAGLVLSQSINLFLAVRVLRGGF